MKAPSPQAVTALLRGWTQGDAEAGDKLLPLVYAELRRRAARHLRRERAGHTLQPTALVHEACLRLMGQKVAWQSRAQFFGLASQMMRRILVDHARGRQAGKRSGGWKRVELEEAVAISEQRDLDLVLVDQALEELAALDARQARLVELRFFGGLTVEETAEVLSISPATVKREWSSARAWLYQRVAGGPDTGRAPP